MIQPNFEDNLLVFSANEILLPGNIRGSSLYGQLTISSDD